MKANQNLCNSVQKTDSRFVLLACLWLVGPAAAIRAGEPQEVFNVSQLYTLSQQQLSRGLPFKLEGIVLCYDADWHQLYVHSSGSPHYIPPQQIQTNLKPGDWVRITGVTIPVVGVFPVTNLSAVILGHALLPPARHIELSDLASTAEAWVQVVAPVRAANASRGRLELTVGSAAQSCVIYVMGAPPSSEPKSYVGSVIRVRGINASHVVNGRLTEAGLLLPDEKEITVLQSPANPIERLPVIAIDSLLNRELGPWTNQPVHLNGVVVSAVPGESLVLRDPTGVISAHPRQVNALELGERADVWGYLDVNAGQSVLADAYFESLTSEPAVAPPIVPATNLTGFSVATFTNIAELRKLSREQLASEIPVKIRGVVIYRDPDWHTAFVYEPRAAVYAQLNQPDIELGQIVELTGRATPGSFGPAVQATRFEALGQTNLPNAVPADFEDIVDGHLDAQWIEMNGVVRRAVAQWGHLHLSVMSLQGKFKVVVPGFTDANPPTGLVGSRVAVQGICGSDLNARNQLSGITIYSPSLKQINILEAAPNDPFAVRPLFIGDIATFNPKRIAGGRVKVAGVVTLNVPGQGFYLEDPSGGIYVQTQSPEGSPTHPGETAEVLGFPALGEFSPHLEDTIIKRVGAGPFPAPHVTTAEQLLLDGRGDGSVVRLQARLLQPIPRAAQPKLIFQEGPIIFSAQSVNNQFPESMFKWRPGSLVRLTGVCLIQGADNHLAQSFRLLVSDPNQLALIEAPPAWTRHDVLLVAAALGICALLAYAWTTVLRRQVRTRTADLRASQSTLQCQFECSQALSELGARLNAAAIPKDAARIIIDVADRLLGWDACLCGLYSQESKLITPILNVDLVNGKRTECPTESASAPPSAFAQRAIESGAQLVLRTAAELAASEPAETLPFGDKTRRSASLLYVPIRHGSNVVGVLSIQSYSLNAYDQDDLRRLEDLAEHCSGALNRIKAQENLRQTQEQLRQSQKLEAIGQLAGGVAHDFNNVLAVIRGNAELISLKPDRLDTDARDCLKHVIAACDRAAKLSRQLLIFGRKQVMQPRPVDLNALVANLTQMLKRTIGEHVNLQCDYFSKAVIVEADAGMLEQVLVNLVVNARDAMPNGGRLLVGTGLLELSPAHGRLHQDARPGTFATLSVQDSGTGIAPEILPHIFEPFFTTKDVGKGTGLGLATVYGIVKQHEGWIEVASALNSGSTFAIFLPALPPTVTVGESSDAKAAPVGGSERILLVEDEEGVRRVSARVLETFGYRVSESVSGADALQKYSARASELDLLLTDVIMPGGTSGRELAEALCARNPNLKVLFTSGYSGDALHNNGFLVRGNARLLTKPCSPDDLLRAVRHCLDSTAPGAGRRSVAEVIGK